MIDEGRSQSEVAEVFGASQYDMPAGSRAPCTGEGMTFSEPADWLASDRSGQGPIATSEQLYVPLPNRSHWPILYCFFPRKVGCIPEAFAG
jgi:hypothetical protein